MAEHTDNAQAPANAAAGAPNLDRYVRQMRFEPLGEEGQVRLHRSTALLVGCGALGTVLANTLARAGVGRLRIVDRDFIEKNNLQRQVLFDEDDVASGLPKAIAAANKLRRINSEIEIEPHVADLDNSNVESFCDGADIILDGTDNFETRYLVNDAAIRFDLPWVFGGCLGAEGQSLTIIPGETPCLACVFSDPPAPGTSPTCDTAGILSTIINTIASIQASEAIKLLSGNRDAVSRKFTVIDLWYNHVYQMNHERLPDCRACGRRELVWLDGQRGSHTAVLCGRNAVQLSQPDRHELSLDELARKLDGVGQVSQNPFLLRLSVDDYTLTVFRDGRAIIGGTEDIPTARTVYAKYIGS